MPAMFPELLERCHAKLANKCHAGDKCSRVLPLGILE